MSELAVAVLRMGLLLALWVLIISIVMAQGRDLVVGRRNKTRLQQAQRDAGLVTAVPAAGAVLVPLNPRLSARELNYILEHCGARVVLADVSALETVAEKWLATIAPATAADVNPFSGAMSLVVEPRLTSDTRWYVTADPGEIDGLEFAYLSGNEGPQVESRSGWDVDGVEIRVILDYGAGFIDHRGWFQNPGA